jgi:ABC-type polysaccharide/polyol phosphate export permease
MKNAKEILYALYSWRIWLTFAVDDVIGRYRRTVFGPFWIVIAQAAFIGGLFYLHGAFSGRQGTVSDTQFLLYLSIGLPVWGLIAGSIIEGCNALVRTKGFIESYPLPLPIHIIRSVMAQLVTFAHVILVYVLAAILTRSNPGLAVIAVIPALIMLVLFSFGAGLALGPLGARFRDLAPGLTAVINLLFVLTPVFWVPSPDQLNGPFIKYNPFYYLLQIVREPFMGHWGSPTLWCVGAGLTVASLLVGSIIFIRTRHNVVYWL